MVEAEWFLMIAEHYLVHLDQLLGVMFRLLENLLSIESLLQLGKLLNLRNIEPFLRFLQLGLRKLLLNLLNMLDIVLPLLKFLD